MSITIADQWGDYLHLSINGTPTGTEISAAMQDIYQVVDFKNVLWDCRNGSLSSCSADDFRLVAAMGARFVEKRGGHARTGVLVRNEPEVWLVRAFIAICEPVVNIEFDVSMDFETLITWLSERAE